MPPRSRQTAAAPGQRTVAQVPKKTFVFKQQAGRGLMVAPRHRGSRTSVARVNVVRNTFQKGDFKDRVTGTLSIEWVPRYGSNEIAKEKTSPILLAEESRFNTEKKVTPLHAHSPTWDRTCPVRNPLLTFSRSVAVCACAGLPRTHLHP